jgi:hypothetical protein
MMYHAANTCKPRIQIHDMRATRDTIGGEKAIAPPQHACLDNDCQDRDGPEYLGRNNNVVVDQHAHGEEE